MALHLGRGQRPLQLALQPVDDDRRRALGRQQAEPDIGHVAWQARLGQRGHFRQLRRARAAGHGQRAQLAGADVRHHARRARQRQQHRAGQQVGGGLAAAAVGHMRQLHAGHAGEQRHEQVLATAIARRRVVELARPLARVGHQFGHAHHRQRWVSHQHAGLAAQQRDGGEVVYGLEAQLRVERGGDGVGLRRQQQGVAVGRRLGHCLAADGGAGARPVVDDDLLLQALAEFGRDDAHGPVHRTARREGHDDADRAARVVLRLNIRHCQRCQRSGQRGDEVTKTHVSVAPRTRTRWPPAVAAKPARPPAPQVAPPARAAQRWC